MSALLKSVSDRYPAGEMMFFRSAIALIPLLIWIYWTDILVNVIRTKNIKGHFYRSFLGCFSMITTFSALRYLPLQDSVIIGYTSPIVLVIFAALFLGERVRFFRWFAVIIGLIGVLVMMSPYLDFKDIDPSSQNTRIGAFFALTGAVIAAGAGIQIRNLTRTERVGTIVFYFSSFSALIALTTWPLGFLSMDMHHWHLPDTHDFMIFTLAGICGGIAQILLTSSLAHADASVIAPFEYTSMIWAILLGYFIFGDIPVFTTIFGGIIVASTGIFIVLRERYLGLARKNEIAANPNNPVHKG